MESAPPLNLSTTVKVEDLNAMVPEDAGTQEYLVEGELVEETQEEDISNETNIYDENIAEQESNVDPLGEKNENASQNGASLVTDRNSTHDYKCSECSAYFSRASQLRAHERTHFEELTYECDQCEEAFARIGLLMSHRREHHRQSFSCRQCDAKFSHYNSYQLHMRRHKGEKPHKCPDCHMAFVQPCHLSIHRRIHTGEKPFKCSVCFQTFKQVSHLTTHMRTHTNDKPYSCNICSASFSQTSSLKRHTRRHTGEKPYKCNDCGMLFVERRNLARHNLTHTGEKPFKCEICPSSFTQMIDLKRHQMSHSGLKPFKCDVCEAAFSRKNNLRWHKLTHEGDTPYKCEKCNAGFSLQRDMKNHMKSHSDVKPYHCEVCGANFAQLSTLKRHKLSHSEERLFHCNKCTGAFKDKSALKRHMSRHNAVKSHACGKCDATFIESRNLTRHRVIVHGEERFESGQSTVDSPEPEDDQNIPPPKKRAGKLEDNSINQIFETTSHPSAACVQIQDPQHQQQHNINQSVPLAVAAAPLPLSNQTQVNSVSNMTTTHSQQQSSLVNEIVTIPPHAPGQMPTLLLTQPGQPPKPARPANNCQNHHTHVLTYFEGSYNQWQSWCFCDTPNIPDASQTIIDSSSSVSSQSVTSSISAATIPQQQITYSELHQPQPQQQQPPPQSQPQQTVQEVSQTEYHQAPQYNNGYPDPVHHYEGPHHREPPVDSLNQHHEQQHQQQHQPSPQQQQHQLHQSETHHQEDVKLIHQDQMKMLHQESEVNAEPEHDSIYGLPSVHDDHSQTQPQHQHMQQQQQQQQSQIQPPLEGQQEDQQLPQQPTLPQQEQQQQNSLEPQDSLDAQVTYQYSLTVNNPATGDIQIQSEAFPANPMNPPADAPIKKRRLAKTFVTNEPIRSYSCEMCNKIFTRFNHLLIHQRTHTGEKPFQCGICYQAFTHKNSLTIHMRGHTGERPFVCVTCRSTFTQKSNLRVHMRTHTGEKPFKCDVCEASFSQGSHLTAHKRIHNNDRPFVCDNCQQTFTQRSALKRHLMTHTGDKPHQCEECNARFSQRDDLRRHHKIHTGDKVVPCTYKQCTSSFNDKAALARHIRSRHQGKSDTVGDKKKKKRKKPVNKQSAPQSESPKQNRSTNAKDKVKPSVLEATPTRTSRRIREAAEKKKPVDSDFIIGDFVEIDDRQFTKPRNRNRVIKKEKPPVQDVKPEAVIINKVESTSDDKMESWCFCEVPHGPDEPHTHVTVEHKSRNDQSTGFMDNESTIALSSKLPSQATTSLVTSDDATGATSLLQLSMEHMTHSQASGVLGEALQSQPVSSTVTVDAAALMAPQQMAEGTTVMNSSSGHHVMAPVNQVVSSDSQSVIGGQVVSTVSQPGMAGGANNHKIVGQSIVNAGQVVSTGTLVGTSQIVAPEGTIYIEAGEMLSNGAVVINPGQGTFISYDQITIGPEGQVLGVPVGTGGTETLMLQPTAVPVDGPAVSGAVTYTTAAPISDPGTEQPVQYTALGNEVINLFPSVEQPSKDTNSAAPTDNNIRMIAKPLECCVCAKAFAQKRTLWAHMKESHPELHSCSDCCGAFTTAEFLSQHKAQHQKLHICSRCSMAFNTKSALSRHRHQMHVTPTTPTEVKVYACNGCDARFHQQSDLRRHMLGHTGEKPYKCKHCDAGFTRTSSLNKHTRIHTGEKPYVCGDCDQAFSYRYQFNRHRTQHRHEEPRNNFSMPYVFSE